MISIRNEREIGLIKYSAGLVAQALKLAESLIKPGIETIEIDKKIEEFIVSHGARPAFKGFQGFPASSCISIDAQVVHGIPSKRALKEGEIVSIDIGVEKDGYYGDAAKTFAVGSISDEKQKLMDVTLESLDLAVEQTKIGNRLSDIGYAVQKHVEAAGFSVVVDLVGHGIGTELHEAPQIPNYGEPGRGPRLKEGMVFAIEPMVNVGTFKVKTENDDWTVVTLDGKPSAHFEHTVAITKNGPEILSRV